MDYVVGYLPFNWIWQEVGVASGWWLGGGGGRKSKKNQVKRGYVHVNGPSDWPIWRMSDNTLRYHLVTTCNSSSRIPGDITGHPGWLFLFLL